MKPDEMSMKSLLTLHNAIAHEPAGSATFATRSKLIARIEQIAAAGNIDLASLRQIEQPEAPELHTEPQADAAETPDALPETPKKPGGRGSESSPASCYSTPPAGHTPSSPRWSTHRSKVRRPRRSQSAGMPATCAKKGVEVPARQKSFPAEMTAEQSAEWLAGWS